MISGDTWQRLLSSRYPNNSLGLFLFNSLAYLLSALCLNFYVYFLGICLMTLHYPTKSLFQPQIPLASAHWWSWKMPILCPASWDQAFPSLFAHLHVGEESRVQLNVPTRAYFSVLVIQPRNPKDALTFLFPFLPIPSTPFSESLNPEYLLIHRWLSDLAVIAQMTQFLISFCNRLYSLFAFTLDTSPTHSSVNSLSDGYYVNNLLSTFKQSIIHCLKSVHQFTFKLFWNTANI